MRWGVGMLAAGAPLLLGLSACGQEDPAPQEARDTATEVQVWTMEPDPVDEVRQWSGRLEALRALSIQAPHRSRVADVPVREGDRVSQGEVLVRLASPQLEARRDALQDQYDHLSDELERWRRLAEMDAAGPMEVSEATRRTLEVREALAEVEATLESAVVQAPAAGQVASIAVSPGSEVEAGDPLLRVDDVESTGVRLTIPARETSFLEDPEHLTLRDDRGAALELDRVAYSPAEQPGFVQADLFLTGSSNGRIGQVDVSYEATEEALVVPWTAVASEAHGDWVALLSGDPPVLERRFVELGRAHPLGIEVVSGLEAGDRVVRYEPRAHPEGQEVTPLELGR